MATKRSAPDVHPSRRDNIPVEQRKRRKINPHAHKGKSHKKAHPVNELKSQIRSLRRLLEKNDGLPATVRVEKERALQTAQAELEQAQSAKERSDMIGRWHKIRFFDRQRATKKLKRAKKALESCEDPAEKSAKEQAVRDAEVDFNYAIYYPLHIDYVPLLPSRRMLEDKNEGKESIDEDYLLDQRQGDAKMWERIKRSMADGTLDDLRNGRLERQDGPRSQKSNTDANKDKTESEAKSKMPAKNTSQEDDDSDGGFFE